MCYMYVFPHSYSHHWESDRYPRYVGVFLYKYMIQTSVNLKEINTSSFLVFFFSEYKLSWPFSFIEMRLQKKQKVDLPLRET